MSAPARLALFAMVIIFVFAGSVGVGRISRGDPKSPSPAVTHDAGHGGS